jgi:hypothetical protein
LISACTFSPRLSLDHISGFFELIAAWLPQTDLESMSGRPGVPGSASADAPSAAIMPRLVALLRAALDGLSEFTVLDVLGDMIVVCGNDPAAAQVANAAGALPLAVRAVVAATRDPRPEGAEITAAALCCFNVLAADRPAEAGSLLTAQPTVPAALSRALELAALPQVRWHRREVCPEVKVQYLAGQAINSLFVLIKNGPACGRAAATSFARAGGASHLVSAPPAILVAWQRGRACVCECAPAHSLERQPLVQGTQR